MKLSEILKDWPEELENRWYQASGQDCYPSEDAYKDGECVGFNKAIKYCDREIDREALIRELKNHTYFATCEQVADLIISTMPTWLKPTERK